MPDRLIRTVVSRLAANKRVRRNLPKRGRLHVDRQLPFLCAYREPTDRDDLGTRQLIKGGASYLIATGGKGHARKLAELVEGVVATLVREFGAFLLVEVWSGPSSDAGADPRAPHVPPRFGIYANPSSILSPTVERLESELRRIKILKQSVVVESHRQSRVAPPGMPPLVGPTRAKSLSCWLLGIEVPPVYRQADSQTVFPMLLRRLRSQLNHALKRSIFEFVSQQTTHSPPHYHALGRRAVVKAVWDVDAQLESVGRTFDFLLQVTPVNSDAAWQQFKTSRFSKPPDFHYLPLPVDPSICKRDLYRIPIERVEDPALHNLFQQKREEMDRQLTMLRDRNTRRFLYGSLQLFGPVSDQLSALADQILSDTPARTREESRAGISDAQALADRARIEFQHYRADYAEFDAQVELTDTIAGIMVSRGKLLINKGLVTPQSRVDPLLHHEIGTHLLTYFNGGAQPFRQLQMGLAGYDELQEGLAVLAEYLVGGLSRPRMRQLAARVIAVREMTAGASFVETFRLLDKAHDFSQRTAYTITMRVYRGGGLTKDMVYLRGLQRMLEYLARGGSLEPLFVGKLAAEHIPVITELQLRKVLKPAPLRPRYLASADAQRRLDYLRRGVSAAELVNLK